jgi:hypothetical protein
MGLDLPPGGSYQGASGFNGNIIVTRNHGFRAFRWRPVKWDSPGGEARLTSLVFTDHEWHPGVNHSVHETGFGHMGAKMPDRSGCPFPHMGCSHGYYAYYDIDHFDSGNYNNHSVRVDGVVDGFGRCVIGDLGYRSEYAVIVAFTKPYLIDETLKAKLDLDDDQIEPLVDRWLQRAFPQVPLFGSLDALKRMIPLDGRPPRNAESE